MAQPHATKANPMLNLFTIDFSGIFNFQPVIQPFGEKLAKFVHKKTVVRPFSLLISRQM